MSDEIFTIIKTQRSGVEGVELRGGTLHNGFGGSLTCAIKHRTNRQPDCFDEFRQFWLRRQPPETQPAFADVCQQVPLQTHPTTCHKRKQKMRCRFQKVALQKLHCSTRFSAVRTSFLSQKLRCNKRKLHCSIEKAALQESCAFLWILGSHVRGGSVRTHTPNLRREDFTPQI